MKSERKPKKIKKPLFEFKTINAQITVYFSVLLTVIMACIIIVVSAVFSQRFTEQKTEIMKSTLETVSGSIESRLNNLRKLSQAMRRDNTIKQSIDNGEILPDAQTVLDELYMYGLQSVVLISSDFRIVNNPYVIEIDPSVYFKTTGFTRFINSKREEIFSFPHAFPYLNEINDSYYNTRISYFFLLRDRPDMEAYGYVQMNMIKDTLFADRSSLISSQFDQFYIIDGAGNVVYSGNGYDNQSEIQINATEFSKNNYVTKEIKVADNMYFHYHMPSYPDWHMVGVASVESITSSARLITLMVVFLGIAGVLMVVVLSLSISKRITSPIQKIGNAMRIFESGTIPLKLETYVSGEVGQLMYGFNNMVDNIETNIETIYIEQEEKKQAEVTALQYQLQSLQQQINPHFLYNTLNVISYLAMEKKTEEIRAFVHALNQLLRATLSNSNEEVTMRQETSFIKAYAHLMEYRYKDIFELELEVDDDTLDCMLPKLILQPLVENALLHGIFPCGKKCSIIVRACCVGDRVCVSVVDEGVGIPKEKMEELFSSKKGFNSIGITNINDRLRMSYGQESQLHVYSEQGKGTIASFSIPIKYEED